MTYRDEKEQVVRHTWNIWPERVAPKFGDDVVPWTFYFFVVSALLAGFAFAGLHVYDWRQAVKDEGTPITSCFLKYDGYNPGTYEIYGTRGRSTVRMGTGIKTIEEAAKLRESICPKP